MIFLLTILILSTISGMKHNTTLICQVCGCPDGDHGDVGEEGVEGPGDKIVDRIVSYEDCSGQCNGM